MRAELKNFLPLRFASAAAIAVSLLFVLRQICMGQVTPRWDPLLSYCVDQGIYDHQLSWYPLSVSVSRKTVIGYSYTFDVINGRVDSATLYFFHGLDTLHKTKAFGFKSLPVDSHIRFDLDLKNFRFSAIPLSGSFFNLQHDSWSKNEDTVYLGLQGATLDGKRLEDGYYFFDISKPRNRFQLHKDPLLSYCFIKEKDTVFEKRYRYAVSPDRERVIECVYFYHDDPKCESDSAQLYVFSGLDTMHKVKLATIHSLPGSYSEFEVNIVNFGYFSTPTQGNFVTLRHDSWSAGLDTFYFSVKRATIADGYYFIDLSPMNTTKQFELKRDFLLNYCNEKASVFLSDRRYQYNVSPGAKRVVECIGFNHDQGPYLDSATFYCFDGVDTAHKSKLVTVYPLYDTAAGYPRVMRVETMDILYRYSPTTGHFFDLPHHSWSKSLDTFYFGVARSTINKEDLWGNIYDYFALPLPPYSAVNPSAPPEAAPGAVTLTSKPNPFCSYTSISVFLPRSGNVTVSIFNHQGRLVRSFEKYFKAPGSGSLVWDGAGRDGRMLPNGAYTCRIGSGGFAASKTVVLMR